MLGRIHKFDRHPQQTSGRKEATYSSGTSAFSPSSKFLNSALAICSSTHAGVCIRSRCTKLCIKMGLNFSLIMVQLPATASYLPGALPAVQLASVTASGFSRRSQANCESNWHRPDPSLGRLPCQHPRGNTFCHPASKKCFESECTLAT